MSKKLLGITLLVCILLFAFWIRAQGTSGIPDKQFTGYDAYLYYWQAEIVSEQGHLPERDMYRWLPLGRDLGQSLNLYSYALAYAHKVVKIFFPSVSLYHVTLYAPPICFVIGLGVLCVFLCTTYDLLFSSIVGILLATLIGTIGRSSVGFGDRDSWCFMLAVLAITTYLASLQTQSARKRLIFTFTSGITVFLGGLSWEAFGFFVNMMLAVELWRFCTTDTESHRKEYILWILMFVPTLYLASPAYRSGYGFSTHVTALMLIPPLVVFVLRSIRYLLLDFSEQLRPYARQIAWFLTLGGIIAGLGYIVMNLDTFVHTAYPFRENRLMRSVSELAKPSFSYWTQRYGNVFVLGSIGLAMESVRVWKWKGLCLAGALMLFFGTTFFRWTIGKWVGSDICNILFFASLVLVLVGVSIVCLRKEKSQNELVMLITIMWALLWMGLAREGKRYDFFIGMPLAIGTAALLWSCPLYLVQTLKRRFSLHFRHYWITACITIAVFGLALLWAPLGGHGIRSMKTASQTRDPVPGKGEIANAFQWINTTLPQNTIVGANWDLGSQLNVLGGVKTIIDQDHFIPYWIHLYYRHVFCAQSEQEALSFLKTHGATHLMVTQKEVISLSKANSFIGSNANADRRFGLFKLQRNRKTSTETHHRMLPQCSTPLDMVEVIVKSPEKRIVTARFKTQDTVSKEIIWNANKPVAIEFGEGGIILYFDFKGKPYIGYYIPPVGWNSLGVKLFMRSEHSPAFTPIYPVNENDIIKIKMWEIHYPADIQTDPKYIATEPGE